MHVQYNYIATWQTMHNLIADDKPYIAYYVYKQLYSCKMY